MSKIKLSNWKKRTPEFWRKVGNASLIAIPALQFTMNASPLGADARQWIVFGLSLALVGVKFITKLFAEEEVNEE